MNSFLLISPDRSSGFQPIVSGEFLDSKTVFLLFRIKYFLEKSRFRRIRA